MLGPSGCCLMYKPQFHWCQILQSVLFFHRCDWQSLLDYSKRLCSLKFYIGEWMEWDIVIYPPSFPLVHSQPALYSKYILYSLFFNGWGVNNTILRCTLAGTFSYSAGRRVLLVISGINEIILIRFNLYLLFVSNVTHGLYLFCSYDWVIWSWYIAF